MTTNALMELAACPFCGHTQVSLTHTFYGTYNEWWTAECTHVNCPASEVIVRAYPKEDCIAKWNTRTQLRTAASGAGEVAFYVQPGIVDTCKQISSVQNMHRIIVQIRPGGHHTVPLYLHPGAGARDAAAERYRWLRDNLLWAKSYDGHVRWTVEIDMPEPGIAESSPPVAESLDAAIDAALRTRE